MYVFVFLVFKVFFSGLNYFKINSTSEKEKYYFSILFFMDNISFMEY